MNVICKECYMVRNIDLFMDFDHTDKCFKCLCEIPYEKNMIEEKILFLLKESFKYYINQDKYCSDCKSLKEDFLARKCACGGNFKESNDKVLSEYLVEAKNGFINFKNLANLCEFELLQNYLVDMSLN